MLKILIVDDEPTFREYLRTVFDWQSHGFIINGEARNGVEALKSISEDVPDIILLDINMPLMDGLTLSEKIREQHPEVAILLITGHSEFEYARKAVRLGIEDYILKPFNKEELLAVLARIKENIIKKRNEKAGFYSSEKNEKILLSLRLGELNQVQQQLEEVLAEVKAKKLSKDHTVGIIMGLVSLCLSYVTEKGYNIECVYGSGFSPFKDIAEKPTFEAISEWVKEIFEKAIRYSGGNKLTRSRKIVEIVREFIEENYHDNGLTVEKIAGNVYINSSYLRKVFKKELDMTVTDYVTQMRMNKAKELLKSGNIKLSDVAEMLGYSDASYFSKCFKKYYGLSPSEFEIINK